MRAVGLWWVAALLGVACGRVNEAATARRYPVPTVRQAPEAGGAAPVEAVHTEPTNAEANRVAELQSQLAPYVVGLEQDEDRADFTIPPPARPKLSQLEDALLDYVEHELVEATRGRVSDAADLSARLLFPLREAHVVEGFGTQSFGSLLDLQVRPEPHGMLAVVVTLGMSCGSDSTLHLFQGGGSELRRVLTAAARNKKSIADGQLFLEYAVIPTESGVQVAVAHTTPWCTSAWRSLRYGVLEATQDPSRPKRVLRKEDSVWIGNRFAELSASHDAFQIRYDSWDPTGVEVVREKRLAFQRRGSAWPEKKQ
jgi:hypothetical protein